MLLMGKSTFSMAIFNNFLYVYQRVPIFRHISMVFVFLGQGESLIFVVNPSISHWESHDYTIV